MNCWPSGKYVHLLYMYSILGRGSFCFNNNNNLLHLYSAFLDTQSTLHSKGAISSSTTSVQHPPEWCDGSHSAAYWWRGDRVMKPISVIAASIRRVMEMISLWHCWGGIEAQVSLTVAFSSSAFFGLLFLIFLLTILIDSMGSGLVSLLASQAHQHHGHLTNFWCFWQCGQVPNPAGKWNQHL